MYLLHVLGCLMRWHQLVRTLISIGAQTRFVCHAVSRFNCVWRRKNKMGRTSFFSLFVHFLLFPFFCSQKI